MNIGLSGKRRAGDASLKRSGTSQSFRVSHLLFSKVSFFLSIHSPPTFDMQMKASIVIPNLTGFHFLWKSLFVVVCESPLALFHFKIQLPQIKPQSPLQLLYGAFSVCFKSVKLRLFCSATVFLFRAKPTQLRLKSSLDTSRICSRNFKNMQPALSAIWAFSDGLFSAGTALWKSL